MSERPIVRARRPATSRATPTPTPINLESPITSIPELAQKRHFAYTQILGMPFLLELFGNEDLAKSKRDHIRRYLYTFVNTLVDHERFNGTLREFIDILKERIREKVQVIGMSASPPRQVTGRQVPPPARPSPPLRPVPAQISPPRPAVRRQRSPGNSQSPPEIDELALAIGNMNVGERLVAPRPVPVPISVPVVVPPPRPRQIQRRRIEVPPPPLPPPVPARPTQRQLEVIARAQATARAEAEERQRIQVAREATRQRRQEAPQRRQAVSNVTDLLREFNL
jgi:hypothetical protein